MLQNFNRNAYFNEIIMPNVIFLNSMYTTNQGRKN